LGVTVAAIFFLLIAAGAIAISTRYILQPTGNKDLVLLFTRLKLPVTFLNLLAVPSLLTAGLAGVMFRGLWEKLAWARIATIFFSFVVMLMALAAIAFFLVFSWGGKRGIWLAADIFVIFSFIFVYFIKVDWDGPEDALMSQPATPAAAPPPPPQVIPPAAPARNDGMSLNNAPTVQTPAAAAPDAPTIKLDAPPAATPPVLACLTILSGPAKGKRFVITDNDTLIGRHPSLVTILLDDLTISARHAFILHRDGAFILKDLDSTNGSFVNGQRVRGAYLHDMDTLTLGAVDLEFSTYCP
jgi:hypothetical protein